MGVALLDNALFQAVLGRPLETSAALLPQVGEQLPKLSAPPILSLVGGIALLLVFLMMTMGSVVQLVKDRVVDKTTHQLIVMGLDPRVRWLSDTVWFCIYMWLLLGLGVLLPMAVYPSYPLTPTAFPALVVLILLQAPGFYLFMAM